MIKVLIIEDSALMRKYLREILEEDGGFEVSSARDGVQGLELVHKVQPDVVTLDINMPEMDGMTCLSRIMVESPRPVVMVSSLTLQGAMATLESLAMGAVDYISKPGGTVSHNIKLIAGELTEKVRAASKSRVRSKGGTVAQMRARAAPVTAAARRKVSESTGKLSGKRLMLVGSSTGGPRTVEEIFTKLPANFPVPIILSQHMPATFTDAFARRLDTICDLKVQQAGHISMLEPGNVYVAKGEADILVRNRNGQRVVVLAPPAPEMLWHPSIERMVSSALECIPAQEMIAVQLTGMGYDGAKAMTELKKQGGHTIAESEATAVVFGMPKELIEMGGASVVLPYDRIAEQLLEWLM